MCTHEDFEARVEISRLEDTGGFAADVTVKCAQCGTPFQFLGLPGGLHPSSPTTSVDMTEARMPIRPFGFDEMQSFPGFTLKKSIS